MREKCSFCGVKLTNLNRYLSRIKKHSYICKICSNKENQKWQHNNLEKCKIWSKNYYITHKKEIISRTKKNNLKRKYGLLFQDYNQLFELQNGKCLICNNIENKRLLSVDHDHKTGKIRGLLCSNCNTGLGNFKDNSILLEKAIKYLKETK